MYKSLAKILNFVKKKKGTGNLKRLNIFKKYMKIELKEQ